jgi:hypothetical protein
MTFPIAKNGTIISAQLIARNQEVDGNKCEKILTP